MSKQPTLTSDLSREEKITRIFEVVGYNQYIEDFMWRLSDYEAHHKTIMIGDVLDWIHHNKRDGEYNDKMSGYDFVKYIDSFHYGVIIRWNKLRGPLEEQPTDCVDYIYSLLS